MTWRIIKMKLYKENKVNQEWELSNQEIAKRFIESEFNIGFNIERNLVIFLTDKDGLNSVWDWDEKKGSIHGSKDVLEIIDVIYNLEEKKKIKVHDLKGYVGTETGKPSSKFANVKPVGIKE